MKTKFKYNKLVLLALPMLLAACGAKKNLVKTTNATTTTTVTTSRTGTNTEMQKLAFLQKVADNSVYAKNIVGDMKFNLVIGDKNITATGALRMRNKGMKS